MRGIAPGCVALLVGACYPDVTIQGTGTGGATAGTAVTTVTGASGTSGGTGGAHGTGGGGGAGGAPVACLTKLGGPAQPATWGRALPNDTESSMLSVNDMAVDASGRVALVGGILGTVDLGAGPLSASASGSGILALFDASGTPVVTEIADVASPEAVLFDAAGDLLVAGSDATHMFLEKRGADGTLIWSKVLATWSNPSPQGELDWVPSRIVEDASGDLTVAGSTMLGSAIDLGAQHLAPAGADIFVARLDPSGEPLWATLAGFAPATEPWVQVVQLGLDGAGAAVVLAGTAGNVPGAAMLLAKLDAGGAVWRREVGLGSTEVGGDGLAVDTAGNALVSGRIEGAADFGDGVVMSSGDSRFMARYDASGALSWSALTPTSCGDTVVLGAGAGGAVVAVHCDPAAAIYAGSLDPTNGVFTATQRYAVPTKHVWTAARHGAGGIALVGWATGDGDFTAGPLSVPSYGEPYYGLLAPP